MGACYTVDALTFLAALDGGAALPAIRPNGETASRPGVRAIPAGLGFIDCRPLLRGAFGAEVIATVLATPVVRFPVVNDERCGGNPETLGLSFRRGHPEIGPRSDQEAPVPTTRGWPVAIQVPRDPRRPVTASGR